MFKSISVFLLTFLITTVSGVSSFADENKEKLKIYQSGEIAVGMADGVRTNTLELIKKLKPIGSSRANINVSQHYNGEYKFVQTLKIIVPDGCHETIFDIGTIQSQLGDRDLNAITYAYGEAAEYINRMSSLGDFRGVFIKAVASIDTTTRGSSNNVRDLSYSVTASLRVTVITTGPEHVCKLEPDKGTEAEKKDNKDTIKAAEAVKSSGDVAPVQSPTAGAAR